MEELIILYQDKKLNTTKAATRRPIFIELATQINDEAWFANSVTAIQLANKYDVERKRYDTWASVAYRSGNTYDEDDGRVFCSDEAKESFLSDHPRQEWVFEQGIGPPAPYQEIWSTTVGKGNNIQSIEEASREVDSGGNGSDQEDVGDVEEGDLHPGTRDLQPSQSPFSSPQSLTSYLHSTPPPQRGQFIPIGNKPRRKKTLTAAEANAYVGQSIQDLGNKFSSSKREVLAMKLKEKHRVREQPSREEVEVNKAMEDLARFQSDLNYDVYLIVSNRLITKEKKLVVSRARYWNLLPSDELKKAYCMEVYKQEKSR
ncbi:hypothetical protein CTRI78_v008980 [Colletotrichum trifolii]|uniref:Myb/SANT-like domain-containing protein n=1 Tax=Colletotrichum trifolii TaxID=5466 RepID=A0A4R8R1U0_COLTR|nr:hypothetical protein CTRI78_v008980 [Colletotrichum trifolii]